MMDEEKGPIDYGSDEEKEEETPKLSRRQLETLQKRREEELTIIAKYDSMPLNRHEAWFLIDADWVSQWLAFVNAKPAPDAKPSGRLRTAGSRSSQTPLPPALPGPPGRLSTKRLLNTETGKPFPNLEKVTHYRGINPTVYHLYKEFYGIDDSPAILRYSVNIYEEDVTPKTKLESTDGPSLKAACEASKVRSKLYPQEVFDVEEKICCCITASLIERLLICLFTCCAKTRTYRYKKIVMEDGNDETVENHSEIELSSTDREEFERGSLRSNPDQFVASV